MAPKFSAECLEVLRLLKDRRNVLISGAPGAGKSRLLSEVANAFLTAPMEVRPAAVPVHVPGAAVAIPKEVPGAVDPELQKVWPAPKRLNRKVFRTAFHQNSKHREFVSGVVPVIGTECTGFKVMAGTLYRASEHSKLNDGASLLVIDEINRGPAVQVFGGSIVSIEPDKRLAEDNSVRAETQFFELVDPSSGDLIEYALPEHLYILAAMNQADVSVEPLDVAFLRRWAPFSMEPNTKVLRDYFGLSATKETPLPNPPTDAKHVFEAAVQMWEAVNHRIRLGRGTHFQLGHGVFMTGHPIPPTDVQGALAAMAEIWGYVRSHIDEVFFGDLRGVAATLNVIGGPANHPFKLDETSFANEPRLDLVGPAGVDAQNIYSLLCAVAG